MLEALARLVSAESFSSDPEGVRRCADEFASVCEETIGARPEVSSGPHPVVRLAFGSPRVLLLGHLDTVWPMGTIARWPFAVADGIATGPGVFDMKAGLVQGLFALASLDDPSGVAMLVTSDEELGSQSSQATIEAIGREVDAVLVLEPSEAGSLKVARKGCATYTFSFEGRASHAGLDPGGGRNALVAMARAIADVEAVGRDDTTVTPTLAAAGTAPNTVPPSAELVVDVRTWTTGERRRVDEALSAVASSVDGVTLRVACTADRPPLERAMTEPLFARGRRIAEQLGLGPLGGVEVGGGSDGNFTAALGTPTLDGLGAVGGGAHAEDEHVVVDRMAERAALVAALVEDIREADG